MRPAKYFFMCAILFLFESNVDAQRLERGSSCRTPNNEWARCTSINNCSRLLRIFQTIDKTKESEQLRFLQESQCGYDSVPLVCCGSATNYYNNNGQQQRFRRNPALPRRNACGFQEIDKIFNGEDTQLDEFPWMALLQYRNASGYTSFHCGGSLINRRYVLTAAHCVTGLSENVGNLYKIRLGEFDTDYDIDCVGHRNCNDPPVDILVKSVVFPDRYRPYRPSNVSDHDIALVRLSREVEYSYFIRPICLPEPGEVADKGEKAIVAGWGTTQNGTHSSKKQKVEVPIVQCGNPYSTSIFTSSITQICAGGQEGKDSCDGDSGGPLMVTTKNDSSQWYLEGIVSYGPRICGTMPGVYVKVEYFLDWIHDNVEE